MSIRDEIRRAIAVGYDPDTDRAPKVIAKGAGPIGDAIVAIAEKHGIRIHEDPVLARSLYVLELGDEIPEEFYVAIAEVLAFVFRLDKKMRTRKGF